MALLSSPGTGASCGVTLRTEGSWVPGREAGEVCIVRISNTWGKGGQPSLKPGPLGADGDSGKSPNSWSEEEYPREPLV